MIRYRHKTSAGRVLVTLADCIADAQDAVAEYLQVGETIAWTCPEYLLKGER